jgi:hypothetical protein
VKDALLLFIGALLAAGGGWLADMRSYRHSEYIAKLDRVDKLRDQQRQAVADVVATGLRFAVTAGSIDTLIIANLLPPVDLANSQHMADHAVSNQDFSRAQALARLVLVDAPRTAAILDKVQNILKEWQKAREKAWGQGIPEKLLHGQLAGPLLDCQDTFDEALKELLTVAGQELVAGALYAAELPASR